MKKLILICLLITTVMSEIVELGPQEERETPILIRPERQDQTYPPVATIENPDITFQEDTDAFRQTAEKGLDAKKARLDGDEGILAQKGFVQEGSPSFRHQDLMKGPEALLDAGYNGIAIEAIAKDIGEKILAGETNPTDNSATRTSRDERQSHTSQTEIGSTRKKRQTGNVAFDTLSVISIKRTFIAATLCHQEPVCLCDKFRTYDGSCNNVNVPLLGKAGTPTIRLLPPAYSDALNQKDPRINGVGGAALPCARLVSRVMAQAISKPDSDHTNMVMVWGQFVDHDLVISPTGKLGYSGRGIECCERDHPECFEICIPGGDPYYTKDCMNFVRTQPSPTIDCTFLPRQQKNDLSHYLDGSNIYGSSVAEMEDLRNIWGGRLKTQGAQLLPPQNPGGACRSPGKCFRAGDVRVNEQPNLALTHTVWMREHNRIAAHYISQGYTSLDAFEMARRVVIAEMVHITYNEFLPIVLGDAYMTARDMHPAAAGSFFTGYDDNVDPSISNPFATAGYRFGHSMIDENIELHWVHPSTWSIPIQLKWLTFFMGPLHFPIWRTLFESGLMKQPAQSVDMCFTKQVTEQLFEVGNPPGSGLDLVSLNIQRARDHGLPSYTAYRNSNCSDGTVISTWSDMTWLTAAQSAALQSVYADVQDIDLYIGGLLEPPVGGGIVGQTFQCLIGDQFFRTKVGDRHWYENPGPDHPFPFTIAQLDEIRKVTLSRIFCDNGDGINFVSPNMFKRYTSSPSHPNFPVSCGSIPSVNLAVFT